MNIKNYNNEASQYAGKEAGSDQTKKFILKDISVDALFETVAEGIVITDESGTIVMINPKLEELTGYKKSEVEGKYINLLIPERFRHKHTGHLMAYFGNPVRRPMGINLDLYLKRKNNTEFPVEISLSFLELKSGRFAMGLITDISARKKAEDQLRARNEDLDAYSYTVAHEINSTLNVLVGLSSVLTDSLNENLDSEQKKCLTMIRQNAEKASTVVNELLQFAGTYTEDVKLYRMDMNKIIRPALKRLDREIYETNAKINFPENFHACLGYGPWVEEIWYNLISNALKYGGKPPEIDILSETSGDIVKYSVHDNGPGWNSNGNHQERLNKIPNDQRKPQGYGLGLGITQRIIEKLGGNFEIESDQKNGSKVSFTLAAPKEKRLKKQHITQ